MASNTYIPITDMDKSAWIKNFAGKLPLYTTTLGLSAAEIASVAADAAMVVYAIDQVESFKKETAKIVAYKNLVIGGQIGSVLGAFPVTGTSAAAPAAIPAGAFKRISKFVQRIKFHTNYSLSIGEDLGIVSHATLKALDTTKPALKITLDAEMPVIKWRKGMFTATDLYVDRGDGQAFVFLATVTTNKYTDTFKLPVGIHIVQFIYKAIYRMGDIQTGSFSDPVSVTITRTI